MIIRSWRVSCLHGNVGSYHAPGFLRGSRGIRDNERVLGTAFQLRDDERARQTFRRYHSSTVIQPDSNPKSSSSNRLGANPIEVLPDDSSFSNPFLRPQDDRRKSSKQEQGSRRRLQRRHESISDRLSSREQRKDSKSGSTQTRLIDAHLADKSWLLKASKHKAKYPGIQKLKPGVQSKIWSTTPINKSTVSSSGPQSIGWKRLTWRKSSLAMDMQRSQPPQIRHLVKGSLGHWQREADLTALVMRLRLIEPDFVVRRTNSFSRFFIDGPPHEQGRIYTVWKAKSWRGKTIWWQRALCYAAIHSPTDAVQIIADVSRKTYLQIPGFVLADALLLVCTNYASRPDFQKVEEDEVNLLARSVIPYLDNYTRRYGHAYLPEAVIRLICKNSVDLETFKAFVTSMRKSKSDSVIYARLHVMHRFLYLNQAQDAVAMLDYFSAEDLLNRAVQSFCITVLRFPWAVDDIYKFRRQLTSVLLSKGIQPDSTVRNVIMQNYLESGDQDSAWRMLERIRRAGLPTQGATYVMFIKHIAASDLTIINRLYEMAKEDGVLHSEHRLGAILIDSALRAIVNDDEDNIFTNILPLYKSLYNIDPLQDFGIVPLQEQPTILRQPTPYVLSLMVKSWIMQNRNDIDKISSAYNNYLFHIRNNHPRIAPLASTTFVACAFVLAFGLHRTHLHMCTKVLQDMIRPMPTPRYATDLDDESSIPDHERFLEPEEVENEPLLPQASAVVESSQEMAEYEEFLEPDETRGNPEQPLPLDTNAFRGWLTMLGEWDQPQQTQPWAYEVAPPNAYVWHALLIGLLRFDQADAAASVTNAMNEYGVVPAEMTWRLLMRNAMGRQPDTMPKPDQSNRGLRPDARLTEQLDNSNYQSLVDRLGDVFAKQQAESNRWAEETAIPESEQEALRLYEEEIELNEIVWKVRKPDKAAEHEDGVDEHENNDGARRGQGATKAELGVSSSSV